MKRPASDLDGSEVGSSRKKLRHIKIEARRIIGDTNNIRRQIAVLEKQRKSKSDDLFDETRTFDDTALEHSKAATRQIVDRMKAKLPRELRDMVYDALWDSSATDSLLSLEKLTYNKCPGGACPCLRDVAIPMYFDPHVFGVDGAIESVEALFRKLPWTTGLVRADDLQHRLTVDPFHIGFDPLNAVRVVTLRFSLDRCVRKEYQIPRRPRVSKSVLRRLAQLPEPERTRKWIRVILEPAEDFQKKPMDPYPRYWFMYHDGGESGETVLTKTRFIEELQRVFPDVIKQNDQHNREFPCAVRYRKNPVDTAFLGQSWIDEVLGPNLAALTSIPNKHGFKLRIKLTQYYQQLPVLERVVKKLAPIYAEFKEEGADVEMELCNDRSVRGRNHRRDAGGDTFYNDMPHEGELICDLGSVFCLRSDQLKEELAMILKRRFRGPWDESGHLHTRAKPTMLPWVVRSGDVFVGDTDWDGDSDLEEDEHSHYSVGSADPSSGFSWQENSTDMGLDDE